LNKSRAVTSAVTINHRFVYVFPGMTSSASHSTIELLDLGNSVDISELK
jgi:hypothetical protein